MYFRGTRPSSAASVTSASTAAPDYCPTSNQTAAADAGDESYVPPRPSSAVLGRSLLSQWMQRPSSLSSSESRPTSSYGRFRVPSSLVVEDLSRPQTSASASAAPISTFPAEKQPQFPLKTKPSVSPGKPRRQQNDTSANTNSSLVAQPKATQESKSPKSTNAAQSQHANMRNRNQYNLNARRS
jgi:hypothetical protein